MDIREAVSNGNMGNSIAYLTRVLAGLRPRALVAEQGALHPAGVFLLLYSKGQEQYVLLNRRTNLVEHHKGEISFPGGAKDPEDESLLATAFRETREEMGIAPEAISVLGQLDPVSTRSSFLITPFVGLLSHPYRFQPNPIEVAEVLEVPLTSFLDPFSVREEVRIAEGKLVRSRSFIYQGNVVWGATAKILTSFLDLIGGKEPGWREFL
ncbi:MAG: CoA pyrophosphatase [Chloroflexi bacterium]|nr:CoA pyrophosphatase [Chloroflexota bacterium]